MTTYKQAAIASYKQLVKAWDDMKPFYPPDNPPASFWIAGNTFQTFLDYWIATGQPTDDQISKPSLQYFHETVKADATPADLNSLTEQGLEGGPWLDDYGWWGNAFMTAMENASALGMSQDDIEMCRQSAENCWQIMNYGWDKENTPPIGGGVWNCHRTGNWHGLEEWKLTGRNSVTNLQYWLLSVRLHTLTQDDRFLDPNTDILKWFIDGFEKKLLFDAGSRLVRERFLGEHDSDSVKGFYWVGDQGLFLACCTAEKRAVPPAFKNLHDDVLNAVLTGMKDDSHVIHDHKISLSQFDNDYATGKGIFMRHALPIAKANQNADLKQCILESATYAWNNATTYPDSTRVFKFGWNNTGKLPPGDWDTSSSTLDSHFRNLILQASGLDAMAAAAALDPNGIVPESVRKDAVAGRAG